MSRIGKIPVSIPAGVEVALEGATLTVKGPKGELTHQVPEQINVEIADNQIVVTRNGDDRLPRSLHGLTRTLIDNMIIGVTSGFEKKLEIVGTGYRAVAKGEAIEFALGFSHPVLVEPPAGIKFTVEGPTKITVSGISKQQVGEVAANIRKIRKPEPYKGKGIRYVGEHVRRKVGKAGK